jgi:hypothetical protein
MAKYVKVAGAWKAVSPDTDSTQTAYVKVGGTWLGVTNAYIKVAGTWRSIFTYSAFIVPNVVNQVLATGRANITNSGNTAGTNTILNNANGANPDNNGKIASQSVTPGVYLTAQTVNVSYYVFAFITVPNLLGQTASAADTLLSNSGNTKGSVVFTASGATANNHATVASQTIPAGSAYTTAQTVGYTLYNYTVPTPSRPSVSLVSKGSNTFTFQTFFGANTTSALAYYGPSGQGNQVFWGTINSNGGTAVVTGLTPGASYSFMSYPVNTENVNTLGSVQQGGLPSLTGSGDPVTLDNVPAPTSGSISQTPSSGAFNIGTTITASTSGWNNNPTSVEIKLVRGTQGVVEGEDAGNNPRATGSGSTSAALSYPVTQADYDSAKRFFRAFARASNAGGTSGWIQTGVDIGPINAPGPTAPNPPSSVSGADVLSPIGGRWSWTAGSGGSGSYSYFLRIYNSNGSLRTGPIGLGDRTYDYTQAGTFYATVETFDLNTGLTSTTATQSATVTFTGTPAPSAPSITASNNYNGGSPNSWTLTVNNSGGAATSFNWGLQFSNSDGGSVLASTTGSGGSIAAGGSATVTRNSSTYSWARWVNITATGAGGSSNTIDVATNGWE